MISLSHAKVAYLGPELPALSATFVYEELLGLERRGVTVVPFSVQRPAHTSLNQADLAQRTTVLYGRPAPLLALQGVVCLPQFGRRSFKALGWLLRDMLQVGPHRLMAWKLAYQYLNGARLARQLLGSGCTHLHVHFAHTPTQIAMYASAFSGVPFTVMAHANDIFQRGLLLPQKAQRSAGFLTISQFNLAYLRSVGVAADKLAVVRCGVSFEPRADVPAYAVKPVYRIGTLCRLVEKKGVDDLIRTLPLLANAPWRVELSIAGDGPLLESLQNLARELKVEHQVQFAGALGHEAVTEWLQSLDVFTVACKKDANGDMDGIPVVLMEAMSQRVPVVSTRLSGIPELVVHDQTGLLSEPANPTALAHELRRLLDHPDLRARLALAGCQHVQAEFGQQVNLDRLLRHFGPEAV
jgi:colanic acid/amylovoran biosynthesis glycosyltransferase